MNNEYLKLFVSSVMDDRPIVHYAKGMKYIASFSKLKLRGGTIAGTEILLNRVI